MKKQIVLPVLVLSALLAAPAFSVTDPSAAAGSGAVSVAYAPVLSVTGHPFEGSAAAGTGSALIVTGLLGGSADTVAVSVANTSNGGKATIAVSKDVIQKIGLTVGAAVSVVAEATGNSLVYAGKLLAFVPNPAGETLLHHSQTSQRPATTGTGS